MVRLLLALVCMASALCGQFGVERSRVASFLGFETEPVGSAPRGWSGGPAGTLLTDEVVVHGGRRSLRIERAANSDGDFSSATLSVLIDFTGKTVEMRGFLRTEDVTGFAGLWMREDGDTPSLAFDNMQAQQLKGTTEWKEYMIRLPLHSDARRLFFGVLMSGRGKTWADDLQLLVDGKPIAEAPVAEKAKTVIDRDHEFDAGSKISLTGLTEAQSTNLTTLGRVWGFLKYHHPRVAKGELHWDYELFRIMPRVLAARGRAAANAVIGEWVAGLGPVAQCTACARLDETELHLRPQLGWLASEVLLGKELSRTLTSIHRNRPADGKQFYVGQVQYVGNPVFEHEPAYPAVKLPDAGYQLLALYRFWNMVEYWFPYRDVIGEDWDGVLARFVPRLALAESADDYQLELMALIASAHDTHANLWSSIRVRPPQGACSVPVLVRFIGDKAVVTGYSDAKAGPETGLKIGDVISSRDGTPIPALVEQWAPYYAASNQPTRLRDIARSMLRGECGSPVRVRREGDTADVAVATVAIEGSAMRAGMTHDLPGETFRLLSKDVAYLKMSGVRLEEVNSYVDRANGTKGLVIDLRNYPSAFLVFALGGSLLDRETPFARITGPDLSSPGAFYWRRVNTISQRQSHYGGKVVILVDEVTQSSAEYTAMAFRASPRATVIGSTTAGADGNVSTIPLPGGLRSMFSGIGIFYPDKRPTQRVGIVPDFELRPTIAGIRAGRDELLEEALRQILGKDIPLPEIQKLIPR